MGSSRKRQSILVGLAKVCAALAPNMQFYFYRIDRKVMGAKWSRALALLLCKEERLRHNVTYREVNTRNQSIKCNKHVLYERGSDSMNFGTRITGFGAVVEKI
jgi:hypothetical protein